MKLIFTLVLSILAIDKLTTINIKISDICIRAQNRCKGFYEYGLKYKTKCEKIACQGKLNFECGLDYCAQNKPNCDVITNLIFLLKSFKRFLLYDKGLERYSNFIKEITYCSADEYSLQPHDICINGDGCYLVTRFLFRFRGNKVTKPIKCRCPANQTYHCGEKFCAIHSDACASFNQTGSTSLIKSCENNNQIIKKFHFFE
jgi:hypothetical protein